MTRLMLCVAMLGLPLSAAAQTTPPTPPVPAPARPVLRAPIVQVPRVVIAPDLMEPFIEDAMRAARESLATVDLQALSEQALGQGQEALVEARRAMEDMQGQLDVLGVRGADGDYSLGLSLLSRRQYDQAIVRFDRVVAQKSARADGALYWKAYAQYRMAKSDEALATIGQLRKEFAQSRYLADARALEADARKSAGQPVNPATLDDDEIKLLAIQGIQNSDPERAVPLLEGVLSATNSLAVKKRALYVLALGNHPKAHQILLDYAKGAGNPDLQIEAIRYLAVGRDKQTTSADLRQIYEGTQDVSVKTAIINAYRAAGDKTALFALAGEVEAPILVRQQAISGLTSIAAPQELWTLYQKETNKDLRLQMVSAFGSMQAFDQLTQVVKNEKDPDVRRRAVRSLGNLKAEKTGQMLADLYGTEQDVATRKAVISALGAQNNAEALIAIARKETSLDLKRAIVQQLSNMAPRSKVAADYLMEIIK